MSILQANEITIRIIDKIIIKSHIYINLLIVVLFILF